MLLTHTTGGARRLHASRSMWSATAHASSTHTFRSCPDSAQLSLTGGNKATAGYPSARPLSKLGILLSWSRTHEDCSWCLIPKQPPDRESHCACMYLCIRRCRRYRRCRMVIGMAYTSNMLRWPLSERFVRHTDVKTKIAILSLNNLAQGTYESTLQGCGLLKHLKFNEVVLVRPSMS